MACILLTTINKPFRVHVYLAIFCRHFPNIQCLTVSVLSDANHGELLLLQTTCGWCLPLHHSTTCPLVRW